VTQFSSEGPVARFGHTLYDGAQHPQYKREGHEQITGQGTITRAGTGYAGPPRRWSRKASTAAILVVITLTMAACSSGTGANLQTAPSKPNSPTTSSTANPKLPAGTASTQQAVLNAWLAAEQQFYTYMDEPPAPLRADLVAGQTTADLFPKLAGYYVNPALQSEGSSSSSSRRSC